MDKKLVKINAKKTIALVAHDNMKQPLAEWALSHKGQLEQHTLCATGTTGFQLERALGLPIHKYVSGPLGGDQQIGAKISEGEIDMLIFFWDPFEPMPHDPDVKALLRIAAVWNVPVACNQASADFILHSSLMNKAYSRPVPDYERYIQSRTL